MTISVGPFPLFSLSIFSLFFFGGQAEKNKAIQKKEINKKRGGRFLSSLLPEISLSGEQEKRED